MKITHTQLRKIIKEEYERVTPVQPGQIMSEARAEYLAQTLLDEGLFGKFLAGLGGAARGIGGEAEKAKEKIKGKAKEYKGKVKDKAEEYKKKATATYNVAMAPIRNAAAAARQSIENIENEALKDVALYSLPELKANLEAPFKEQIKKFLKTSVQSGMSEEEALNSAFEIIPATFQLALEEFLKEMGQGKN